MDINEARATLKKDLEILENMRKDAKDLKEKMDRAEEAFNLKLAQAIKDGKIQSGGYIVTGEEDDGFMETLHDMQEYEEELYAGAEKKAYKEARGLYHDKLIEIFNFEKEVEVVQYAILNASKPSEPGGDDE